MKTTYLLFLFFQFNITFLYSQIKPDEIDALIKKGAEQELVRENSRLMQEGFLYYADKIATKLLEFDPISCNYNYRKGYTTLYSLNDPQTAISLLTVAASNTRTNFDAFSKYETASPHDVHFHLAECLHKLGQYDKAIQQLNIFREKSNKNSELLELIEIKIQQIQNIKKSIVTDNQVQPEYSLNTEFPDFAPLISLDGKRILYTARRPWEGLDMLGYLDRKTNLPPEDCYYSDRSDSEWGKSIRLDLCTYNLSESFLALSSDERQFIFYTDSTGNGDLFKGNSIANFIQPELFFSDSSLNTQYWEPHATLSSDGNTIFFTSNRAGGIGGRDIYYTIKKENGQWSDPMNLGAPINTEHDEDSPFLSFDGKILYFSSNGTRSLGGFDLFYSELGSNGKWSEPVNMGMPINSTYDDIYYSTTIDGKTGYFSSNREGGKGSLDIYSVNRTTALTKIAVLKGMIKTSTGEPLPVDVSLNMKLKCSDCAVKDVDVSLSPRVRDALFFSTLEPCKTYHVALTNPGKSAPFHEETFVTDCTKDYQEIYREFVYDMGEKIIKPVIIEVVPDDSLLAQFKNFEFMRYFGYNKNKVSSSDNEISTILKSIEKQISEGRKEITLNVYSSSSKVPTRTFGTNEKLAQLRAQNLVNELESYIRTSSVLTGKVKVKILSVVVDGPEYTKDSGNLSKYKPYQFVAFKTE